LRGSLKGVFLRVEEALHSQALEALRRREEKAPGPPHLKDPGLAPGGLRSGDPQSFWMTVVQNLSIK